MASIFTSIKNTIAKVMICVRQMGGPLLRNEKKEEGEEEVLSEFMTSKHGTKNPLVKDLSSCNKYDKWTFEKHILCCCKVHFKKISSAVQAQCSVHLQVFKSI